MHKPRKIESHPDWLDDDGIKIYTLSTMGNDVGHSSFLERLNEVKSSKPLDWKKTHAFVIFHEGFSCKYLVLAWWGNDNELFTSVSVKTESGWIEDASQYSFCLWDLEVFWFERNCYIEHIYCPNPDHKQYLYSRLSQN